MPTAAAHTYSHSNLLWPTLQDPELADLRSKRMQQLHREAVQQAAATAAQRASGLGKLCTISQHQLLVRRRALPLQGSALSPHGQIYDAQITAEV